MVKAYCNALSIFQILHTATAFWEMELADLEEAVERLSGKVREQSLFQVFSLRQPNI